MSDLLSLPITDEKEVASLLEEFPIAINKEHFVNFVLGFPRNYLVVTPRVEIVKHYFLMEGLGERPLISALSRQSVLWKLNLITRDRRHLFARICGTLSCFGMDIVSAQAFANANSLVLDTFHFLDPEGNFDQDEQRRNFHHFLEAVLEGKENLEPLLRERWSRMAPWQLDSLIVKIDNDAHPAATHLVLDCQNHFGLLYLVSCCIAEQGHDIVIAYVQTPGEDVHDEFYLTHEGEKLTPEKQRQLEAKLLRLGDQDQMLDSPVQQHSKSSP